MTDQIGRTTTYTYDSNGNLTVKKDFLNNLTTYTYSGTQPGMLTANGAGQRFELHAHQLSI